MKKSYVFSYLYLFAFIFSNISVYADIFWEKMDSNTTYNLKSVWGRSQSDIFAVGESGTILHYNGSNWTAMAGETLLTLNGVWGDENCIYAVGDNGIILKYMGFQWQRVQSNTSADLNAVWGLSYENVYVVGKSGVIIHLVEGVLSQMESSTLNKLNSIWGSAGKIFTVGSGGKILSYNGSGWITEPAQTFNSINDIWAASPYNLFMVGSNGMVLRYYENTWTEKIIHSFMNLNSIWGSTETNIFAVGYDGIILRYDGNYTNEWAQMDSGTNNSLNCIWASSAKDVFAVGDNGTILHHSRKLQIEITDKTSESQGIITGSVKIAYSADKNISISLTSSKPDEISTPSYVIIPKGETRVNFDLNVIDDNEIDGLQDVIIEASAADWYAGQGLVFVSDNEPKALSLSVEHIAIENQNQITNAGMVSINGFFASDLIVHLTSNLPQKLIVPETITIPAGSQQAVFNINLNNNTVIDDLQKVIITASSEGWISDTDYVNIIDDDCMKINLSINQDIIEGSGLIKNAGEISFSCTYLYDLDISLNSLRPDKITLPESIKILKGYNSSKFDITVHDDEKIDGSQVVTISASSPGWTSGKYDVTVNDNENKNINLIIQPSANEGDGVLIDKGMVLISGEYEYDLMIYLSSDAPENLMIPEMILIPKGEKSTTFNLSIIDDKNIGETREVTVKAQSVGWTSASDKIIITDDEKKELSLWVIPNPKESAGVLRNAGTVYIPGKYSSDLVILLSSSNTDRLIVPYTVSINANEQSATFDLTILDNKVIGVDQNVIITASSVGWSQQSKTINIIDDEKKTFNLNIVKDAAEGDGLLYDSGYISIDGTYADNIVVKLKSSNTNKLKLPENIIIPSGKTKIFFDVTIVDNNLIDGAAFVNISASTDLPGWGSTSTIVDVYDNEKKELFLKTPLNAVEGENILYKSGKVSISGAYINDLIVKLLSDNFSRISVPETVVIPVGYTFVDFDITIIDNKKIEDIEDISITAYSSGWLFDSKITRLSDNDLLKLHVFTPEYVNENDKLMHKGLVTIDGSFNEDIKINLISNNTAKLKVPEEIVIVSGKTSCSFNIEIIDNFVIDGDKTMEIIANVTSMSGWQTGSDSIIIKDNELKSLNLIIDEKAFEGEGLLQNQGIIFIEGFLVDDLKITLNTDSTNKIILPHEVIIPEGYTSTSFDISIIDDNIIGGNSNVNVYANAQLQGFSQVSKTITIEDNEKKEFFVFVPESLNESDSAISNAGMISVSGIMGDDLVIKLLSDNESELAVPESVVISKDKNSAYFNIIVKDDFLFDGTVTASIYANASGWPEVQKQIRIIDNENKKLDLIIPESVQENDGTIFNAGMVILEGTPDKTLKIRLLSDDENKIIVPEAVNILPGKTSAFFDIKVINNMIQESVVNVSIIAVCPDFSPDTEILRIFDTSPFLYGDIDHSGDITIKDIISALQILSDINVSPVYTDVNVHDLRKITMSDIMYMFTRLSYNN